MAKKYMDFYRSHLAGWYGSGQCYAGAEEYVSWGLGRTVRVPGYATAWAWGVNWRSTVLGSCCTQVSWSQAKPGDIVFFSFNHVAIVHSGNTFFGQNQNTDGNGGPFNLINLGAPQIILRPNFISNLAWIIPSATRALNQAEMNNNAKCLYGYLHLKHGWTLQACCGVLGNAQYESSINPNRWQSDATGVGPGFGLVQWTPFTVCTEYLASRKAKLSDYGNMECDLINSGPGYYQTASYPLSFEQFKKSTQSGGYLAMAYLYNYERPANPGDPAFSPRRQWGNDWQRYLAGWSPEMPDGAGDGGGSYVNKLCIKTVNGIIKQYYMMTLPG